MTLLVRAPDNLAPERRYIFDVVLSEWLGLEYELGLEPRSDVTLELVGDPEGLRLAVPDELLSVPPDAWLSERSMPVLPLSRLAVGPSATGGSIGGGDGWHGSVTPLPVLYGRPDEEGRFWRRDTTGLAMTIDIFGSVFFLLTRYEEVVRRDRDANERFRPEASVAISEGFLDRPVADEYVDLLWQALHSVWPGLTRRETIFRLHLTHDVDRPWAALGKAPARVLRSVGADLVRRRDPGLAARRVRSVFEARAGSIDHDPFNTFDMLMDTSERYGLTGTFYFMTRATNPTFDGSYLISDPPIRALLARIHERGHTVGLHTSYETFRSVDAIRAEFAALRNATRAAGFEEAVWGVRQHFLRFEAPTTWRLQEAAGLGLDSTMAYGDVNGFRAGTSREYPIFDLGEHRRLQLRERPLIVMDVALRGFEAGHFEAAAHEARGLVDSCRRHAGDATILYHNSSLPGARAQAHYRQLIESLVHPA